MFIKKQKERITIIAVYVDDIIITWDDKFEIETLKEYLDKTFTIKDLGKLHYFLGIEVSYDKEGICLTQHKFSKELLKASGIKQFKKVVTPLPINLKLSYYEGILLEDPSLYRKIIGKLNFLTNTRPNLSYTVQSLSQFMQKPRDSHWKALIHTVNYVYSTCF